MERIEDNIVYVYSGKKLINIAHFKELKSAHRYAESRSELGYYCELHRTEGGRVWAKVSFCVKESI